MLDRNTYCIILVFLTSLCANMIRGTSDVFIPEGLTQSFGALPPSLERQSPLGQFFKITCQSDKFMIFLVFFSLIESRFNSTRFAPLTIRSIIASAIVLSPIKLYHFSTCNCGLMMVDFLSYRSSIISCRIILAC